MMKVPKSVRQIYEECRPRAEMLQRRVDEVFQARKRATWHYQSRVKGIESFALKLESGRVENPEQMDDLFACTLVVENFGSIVDAEELACHLFPLDRRRPDAAAVTYSRPDAFPFDDLRLYLRYVDADGARPTQEIKGAVFELQIKTFLQHAWSIATHDLVYKGEAKNWSLERIAYQVRAMLEHAEVSIAESERLAGSASLRKRDRRTDQVNEAISTILNQWPTDLLPADRKRLAENVVELTKALNLPLARVREVIEQETASGRGVRLLDVSPFAALVQALANLETDRVFELLAKERARFRLFLCPEMVLPRCPAHKVRNAVLVGPMPGVTGEDV